MRSRSNARLVLPTLMLFVAACSSGSVGQTGSGGAGSGAGSGAAGTGSSAGTSGTAGTAGTTGMDAGVPPPGSPTVTSFTAMPATLPAGGGEVTLAWAVTGATSVSIDNGVGAVTGTSAKATIKATTIFTLSATNAKGTTTKSAVVTVAASSKAPVILSFAATPTNLPMGGGMTTLTWQVMNATTVTIDHGIGAQTGTSAMASVTATTIYTLTAVNADGMTTATTAVVVGQNPSMMGSRFVDMISPTPGESFVSPSSLRLIGVGYDPFISTNSPVQGLGANAQKLQFFIDDTVVAEIDGAHAEYYVFKSFASNVGAGSHRVWARGIYTKPDAVLDSAPVLIDVVAPPTYAMTIDLAADVMLSGATGYELVGSAGQRIRLNGHGHRILSAANATGPLTLKFVDVFDLGGDNTGNVTATEVTTSGNITIEDSIFDSSNSVSLSSAGAGTVSFRRNVFRSNMRQPIGQAPRGAGTGPSYPAIYLAGKSTGTKIFAGNNVGAGWVQFTNTTGWTVGGDTDADSNIMIGPRVGIYMETSANGQIRRNYTHHHYDGGWSQGSNYELSGSPTLVVEHNVISGSSWPVRGAGCEFRYNLVVDAGHQYLWPEKGGSIHHNIFVGGQSDIASIYLLNMGKGVKFSNNTLDGMLNKDFVTAISITTGGEMALTSNAFINIPKPPGTAAGAVVTLSSATLTADYNAFGNVQKNNYSDARMPAHDVVLADAAAAMLTDLPKVQFDIDDATIWKRTTTVRDILSRYRKRYTPKDGSPLIDKGDPAGGDGNDIGAVGAGTPNAADKLGLF